ncbi:hypothetical protein ACFVVQ_12105 [Paenibacillus chitinolyticus]|uniref:hypothetical protein n=1 Tax=Paenibacillus chitinolyticus TaxID=79263 RepID=UPI0036DB06C6
MSKWISPQFITGVVTMVAIALNNRFGWHISPDKLVAAVVVAVNFIVAQIMVDIQKMKNGEKPTFNSTKFVTMFIACTALGFSQYLGIELSEQEVIALATTAAAFITAKGVRDISNEKKKQAEAEVYSQPEEVNRLHDQNAANHSH